MTEVVHKAFTEITSAGTWLTLVFLRWEELIEKASRLAGLKEFIIRRIGDRRKNNMIPVGTLINDLSLAVTIIPKIQADIPLIQKTVADIQQAIKDQKDATALTIDLNNILGDVTADLNALAALFPPPATPVTPAA